MHAHSGKVFRASVLRCLLFLPGTLIGVLAEAQDDPSVAATTNRVAAIIASSNYTFSIAFGRQGALSLEGYAQGPHTAFLARLQGREWIRGVDGVLWLAAAGTGGATRVNMAFPLHVAIGYDGERTSLALTLMPPSMPASFLLTGYRGLAAKIAQLPRRYRQGDGWSCCETNEAGRCIEFSQTESPARATIGLIRVEADKSSAFIHELRVAAAPATLLTVPEAARVVTLEDFAVALTCMAELSDALLREAMAQQDTTPLSTRFGAIIDQAEKGLDAMTPPLPPLPGLPEPTGKKP